MNIRTILWSILFSSLTYSLSTAQDKIADFHLLDQKQINGEFLGLSYSHEKPLRPKLSHIFQSGILYSFILTSGNIYDKYMYSLDMYFASGLRYYYRVSDKSARFNQNIGQFVQINAGAKPGSISSKGLHYPLLVYLSPNWGVQIALSEKWNMSFMAGLTVGSNLSEGHAIGLGHNLEFRVGRLLGKKKSNVNQGIP